uniref:Nucleoporin_N domain-containing protein n=1 Tax=Syphacia muris TaxID=451379 RepID=A0A0N5B178_9BILA
MTGSIPYTEITSASFSKLYGVISTSRINTEIYENLIKFWSRASTTGHLRLQFVTSYGANRISIVRITEDSDAVLSVDVEGRMNCWYKREAGESSWHRSSTVTFQDMAVSYASQFKKSLIALIHRPSDRCTTSESEISVEDLSRTNNKATIGGVVVIWDVHSGGAPVIRHCCCLDTAFITAEWDPNPSSSLIFLSSASYICAYNIYTESTIWMVTDLPGEPRIGVTSDYFYFLLNTEVYLLKEFRERLVKPSKFEIPQGKQVIGLLGLNRSTEFKIVLLESQLQSNSEVRKSAFARLCSANIPQAPKTKLPVETKSAIEIFAGPTHALPPVSILAPSFIEASLLPPKVS